MKLEIKEMASPQSKLQSSVMPEFLGIEPLTDEEEAEKLRLERKVERAFYEAGKALQELRDKRLYRVSHATFEEYCAERFGFKRRHPYQLINAAQVVDNLLAHPPHPPSSMCANGAQKEMGTNGTQIDKEMTTTTNGAQTDCKEMSPHEQEILPTSERQVRPLTNLEPSQQRQVWQQAVIAAGNKIPSGRLVKDVVQKIRESHPIPNPWHIDDVATIIVKENPDLRGLGGYWAIITAVHDFSCTVRLFNGKEYQVKPENLKELPYSLAQQQEMKKLGERLSSLYNPEMEETALAILSALGKLDRPWLTEFEESLLKFLEESLLTRKSRND